MKLVGGSEHDRIAASCDPICCRQVPEGLPICRGGGYPGIGVDVIDVGRIDVEVEVLRQPVEYSFGRPLYAHVRVRGRTVLRRGDDGYLGVGYGDAHLIRPTQAAAIGYGSGNDLAPGSDQLPGDATSGRIGRGGGKLRVAGGPHHATGQSGLLGVVNRSGQRDVAAPRDDRSSGRGGDGHYGWRVIRYRTDGHRSRGRGEFTVRGRCAEYIGSRCVGDGKLIGSFRVGTEAGRTVEQLHHRNGIVIGRLYAYGHVTTFDERIAVLGGGDTDHGGGVAGKGDIGIVDVEHEAAAPRPFVAQGLWSGSQFNEDVLSDVVLPAIRIGDRYLTQRVTTNADGHYGGAPVALGYPYGEVVGAGLWYVDQVFDEIADVGIANIGCRAVIYLYANTVVISCGIGWPLIIVRFRLDTGDGRSRQRLGHVGNRQGEGCSDGISTIRCRHGHGVHAVTVAICPAAVAEAGRKEQLTTVATRPAVLIAHCQEARCRGGIGVDLRVLISGLQKLRLVGNRGDGDRQVIPI